MSNLATITNNILADSGIDDINVIVSTGSYADPAWITSLAWTKITGAPLGDYLPLAGGTMTGNINWAQTDRGLTWAFNTDGASIKFYNTSDAGTDSRLEFATLDNDNEYFRWVHIPSGGSLYESMRLVPNSSGNAQLIVSGSIIKSGGTSTQYLMADGSVSTLTNPITGTGTTNYIPRFTGSTTIGNSGITDDGATITLLSRVLSGSSAVFSGGVETNRISTGNVTPFINVGVSIRGTITGNNDTWGVYAVSLTHAPIANNALAVGFATGGTINRGTYTGLSYRGFYQLPISVSGSGTLATAYGMYIESLSGATNNYSAYFAQNVGIGNATPSYLLDVAGTSRFIASQPDIILDSTNNTAYSRLVFLENGADKGGIEYINSSFSEVVRRNKLELFSNTGIHLIPDGSFTAPVLSLTGTGSTFRNNLGVAGAAATYPLTVFNGGNGTTAAFGGTARGLRVDNDGVNSVGMTSLFGVDSSFYGSYQPIRLAGSTVHLGIGHTNTVVTINAGGSLDFNPNGATSYFNMNQGTSADGGFIYKRNNSNRWQLALSTPGDNFLFYSYGISNPALTLNYSTGAATFSGSVTAGAVVTNGTIDVGMTPAPFWNARFRDFSDGSGVFIGSVTAGGYKFISGDSYYQNSGFFWSNNTTSAVINLTAGNFAVYTNSGLTANTNFTPTERFRINSTGAATFTTTTTLGITIVTNDVTTLKMNSSSGATKNWGFATTNLAASDFGIYQSNSNGGDAINAGTARMYFSGSGNVLIGTTTDAGFRLNVNVFSTSDGIAVRKDGSNKVVLNGDGVLLWGPSANIGALTWDTGLARINAQSTNDLDLTTSGGGRIILKSAGNVGIGTSSPQSGVILDVRGSGAVAGGSEGLRLGNVGDNSAYDNVKLWYTGFNGGSPRVYLTPRTTPGSGVINTFLHLLNTNGTSSTSNNTMGLIVDGSATANSLLVERSASRNMLGISSISLPTSGAEEGVAVVKTNSNLWQMSLVGYAVDSKGMRVYNTGGAGYTSFEVAQGAGTRFIVDGVGNIGIRNVTPQAYLDIAGIADQAGFNNLVLRSGNSDDATPESNQILFGYANTMNYAHAIKTRHQSGTQAGNSIEFWVWKYGDSLSTQAGQRVMVAEGNGVRVASLGGTLINPVNGSVLTVNGTGYFNGGVQTAAPYLSSSNNWYLGQFQFGSQSANGTIRVQIGNSYYNLIAQYLGEVPT
jgi:hypothetical protein